MAACGSLQHIFDTLLPENPTLIESLSWNQIKPVKSLEQQPSSLTEIFGELHFKETPISSSSTTTQTNQTAKPPSCSVSCTPITNHNTTTNNRHKSSDSFSSLSSESLQLCTEGLGFESSDDVEDLKGGCCWQSEEKEGVMIKKHHIVASSEEYDDYSCGHGECRRSRVSGRRYPPPISCIGRSGKPGVCFKSFRSNGRFVLREIRIPTQEILHAFRQDGRLKLHFVQPDDDDDDDDELIEEEEEEEEENEDDGEEEEEEEENMGKENDVDCVKDHVNEEK